MVLMQTNRKLIPRHKSILTWKYLSANTISFQNSEFTVFSVSVKSVKPRNWYVSTYLLEVYVLFIKIIFFIEIHRTSHLNIGSNLLLACYWHLHRPSTSPQRDLDFSLRQEIVLTRHMPENQDEIISNCYIGPNYYLMKLEENMT